MIYVIKIILLAVLFCNIRLTAQDAFSMQFNFAKKLYDNEKYFDAVTELKRLLFFDDEKRYSYKANKYLGLSYKQGAKFSDAIFHFTLAGKNSRSSDEEFETLIEIIKINILRRTIPRAIELIDSLKSNEKFADKKNEINYWRGWAYIFADEWENASASFAIISPDHNLKLLCDSVNSSFYDVTLAKVLSLFVPGAGQFYTGEYVSGLLSFGWNVLWGYLTINAFIEERIFDGLMIGSLLWWRFYTGNLQNAEKFALEKNLKISNDALLFLKNSYHGAKP